MVFGVESYSRSELDAVSYLLLSRFLDSHFYQSTAQRILEKSQNEEFVSMPEIVKRCVVCSRGHGKQTSFLQ